MTEDIIYERSKRAKDEIRAQCIHVSVTDNIPNVL